MTIRRTGGNTISLSAHGGDLTANGHFAVVKNRQAIVIAVEPPKLQGVAKFGARITSFPSQISIAKHRSGRLIYTMDRPVTGRVFPFPSRSQPAGSYYFSK